MRTLKGTAMATAALLALYWLVAYLLLPDFWEHVENEPGARVRPMVTATAQGIPGDPINVGLIGSKSEVAKAFATAHWYSADPITDQTSIEIGLSVLLDRPYADAPVSPLFYEGRQQDLAFEKAVGESADQRHHVRLWLTSEKRPDGRPVWLGSASFDRGAGISHDTGQITHDIFPDVDAERDQVMQDLQKAGVLASVHRRAGAGPTKSGLNGEGDPYFTDGIVLMGILSAGR